ncbi:MAG: hypothetical protein EOO09_05900, partial [Chitinophagaceae bacterium]
MIPVKNIAELVSWLCLLALPVSGAGQSAGMARAGLHPISVNKPAQAFMEGAVLGNGGMGVVVTTRPDAVVLYFGHNNVWDIRLAEDHRDELKTFDYVFGKVNEIPATYQNLSDDPWYARYYEMSAENYRKPYPRPFPCGSLLLGFDRAETELLGHHLDIAKGICTVSFLVSGRQKVQLEIFTDLNSDQVLMRLVDGNGKPYRGIFNRVKLMPDPSTPADIPKFTGGGDTATGSLFFRQVLPSGGNKKAVATDKAFSLSIRVNTTMSKKERIDWSGNRQQMDFLESAITPGERFFATIRLDEGADTAIAAAPELPPAPGPETYSSVLREHVRAWDAFWSKSSVALADSFLESIWYRNLYFFNCATRPGVTCPGLFANWSYNNIGTAWHGDYHMNYNTQQPFWLTFSSNHLEKNLAYVDLVEKLMPVSKSWAKEYYNLPGAYFPHSAFPVEMKINPYPVPDWGWEISETPWSVQGLWWHYLYSGDTSFLRTRAYGPMRAATEFLVAYMKRSDAHGQPRWNDDRFHVFPSVPPEMYGLRPGFKYNYDPIADLALIRFLFNAFRSAVLTLGSTQQDAGLVADIDLILSRFPEYPTALTNGGQTVLVAVPGEQAGMVYNVPNPLFPAFPGEDYGLHSDSNTRQLLKATYLNQQNEGGTDLVFANMQAARIGMLDLEKFKRHIRYSLLPNGTATDMVTQTGGRYGDQSDFAYLANMGIWFENFALPAVINECLLQSYNGTITLFPNWPADKDASFSTLR